MLPKTKRLVDINLAPLAGETGRSAAMVTQGEALTGYKKPAHVSGFLIEKPNMVSLRTARLAVELIYLRVLGWIVFF